MTDLVRKYSLFYLTHAGTFFFLCAYSLVANAPNFPFLPGVFFPIYLSSAVALSEREGGDPLLGVLPVTPGQIMKVKFALTIAFVAVGWLNMAVFTFLQDLGPEMTAIVMKMNTISAIYTLALAAFLQWGLHFFGRRVFHKVIIAFTVITGVFSLLFFIGLAEGGRDYVGGFPLIPVLDSLPGLLVGIAAAAAGAIFYLVLRSGPWNRAEWPVD